MQAMRLWWNKPQDFKTAPHLAFDINWLLASNCKLMEIITPFTDYKNSIIGFMIAVW